MTAFLQRVHNSVDTDNEKIHRQGQRSLRKSKGHSRGQKVTKMKKKTDKYM